jgi:hypothetical protein
MYVGIQKFNTYDLVITIEVTNNTRLDLFRFNNFRFIQRFFSPPPPLQDAENDIFAYPNTPSVIESMSGFKVLINPFFFALNSNPPVPITSSPNTFACSASGMQSSRQLKPLLHPFPLRG